MSLTQFSSPDLGFSKVDRTTNIHRLAFIAGRFSKYRIIPIICANNPYDSVRLEVAYSYRNVKTVFIKCDLQELIKRDTKGMYVRALLPDNDPNKITNLSGVNDPFEPPKNPDLIIQTDQESVLESTQKLIAFIEMHSIDRRR